MNAKNTRSALLYVVILGVFLIFVAIVMLLNNQKVNKFPPYQSIGYSEQSSSDEKVRYILLDIQLGDVANYYRKYQDEDSNIRQALNLWDQGVRIVNIYQFDRVEIDNSGWQVVYGGTEKIIVGSDIVLTEDIGATGNDEARIRYILADAQLGGVIDYYRQYTSETSVKKAVKLWDQGVRVVNIGNFQRIIVANAGWQVVYLGSARVINGMDVVLTTDNISGQSSSNQMASCDNNSGETRILYILADIQLSGNRGYYAELADPYALEAVHRWDNGTTVQNINAFERKIIDGKGWQIVYAGTDTTICGNDVITTTSSSNRAITFCNNRYWPIVEGAKWEYSNGYFFIVNSVNGYDIGGTASLSTPTGEMILTCLADGIHNQDFLLLPPEREIGEPDYRDFSPNYIFKLTHTTEKTVPAGTFLAVRVVIGAPYSGYSYLDIWYGKDVGIIEFDPSQDESQYILYNLLSYFIP